MKKLILTILVLAITYVENTNAQTDANIADANIAFIENQISLHPQQTGSYVLDTGAEALIARAWLANYAQKTIEVQYFIWSTDNIGILASEALLSAAERGIKVRVIVDDLLIDAPDKTLLALAKHPNIAIRIYNPKHSVGTPWYKRLWNVVTDFRSVNQRMHDKTFIVDGQIAITGGRNMADEYFDYDHTYNFRDRDVLLLGSAVSPMQQNFNRFWSNKLAVRVQDLYANKYLLQGPVEVNEDEVQTVYKELHDYAKQKENFADEVRTSIAATPKIFSKLAEKIVWGNVDFVGDSPGKNNGKSGLAGGGKTSAELAKLVNEASNQIVIQSPYLVVSDEALVIFKNAMARGVKVRINTNSLASTDNLQAFSGYRNQRNKLLKLGIEIFEYKPNPKIQRDLIQGSIIVRDKLPVFAIHAKTMVIDSKILWVGTFNLDPRSENLNTEVGVIIRNASLAQAVEANIVNDMKAENSWNANEESADQYASFSKRYKVRFWQWMPIKPLL